MAEKQKYTHEVVVIPSLKNELGIAGFRSRESALVCAEHFTEARQLRRGPKGQFIEEGPELFLFVAIREVGDVRNATLQILKGDRSMLDKTTQEPARQPIPVVDLSDISQCQSVISEKVSTPTLPHPAEIPQSSKADPEIRS